MCVSLYSDLEIAYESPELKKQTLYVNMKGINPLTDKLSEKSPESLKEASFFLQ